ncbi:hypothetical protein L1987_62409 [Smallanthus sonchifolius]|uniref:Uncharacterized protein n=2 Tax=Smallanthus sonchifolius TaxID=185202 RepID=A0ACB9CAL5_9ASTR|nr:hypothetical protein L1987_62399 [Smallanthus sonchifolius]KAI3731223.1 hypothetical protein L1987_62409 [Smallanthus sonchifolius]
MGGIDLSSASDWFEVISTLPSFLEIHLSSCLLTQFPSNPTTVGFTSLIVLDLSYNIFSDSLLPDWIFSLHNLITLDLTNCYISGLSPGTQGGFHSMPFLKTLSVSSNTFVNSSSLLNGLSSLCNLRFLDVSNCNISTPILASLHNLSLIVHLDLSNNEILEEIPKSLSNLCNLITLDLQSNNFSGNVSELLERFCECESPKLELLTLRGNYLIGRLPEKLGRLKNLGSIDIAYNQLTGTIPDSVGRKLGNVSFLVPGALLDLSFNRLHGELPSHFNRPDLDFLDLSHNKLLGSVEQSKHKNCSTDPKSLLCERSRKSKSGLLKWLGNSPCNRLKLRSSSAPGARKLTFPNFPSVSLRDMFKNVTLENVVQIQWGMMVSDMLLFAKSNSVKLVCD